MARLDRALEQLKYRKVCPHSWRLSLVGVQWGSLRTNLGSCSVWGISSFTVSLPHICSLVGRADWTAETVCSAEKGDFCVLTAPRTVGS